MAEYKYNIQFDPAAKQGSRVKGIASRPDQEEAKPSFQNSYYEMLSAFFDSPEEAAQAIKPNKAELSDEDMDKLYGSYEAMAEESANLVSQARDALGITQSLTEGGGEAFRTKSPEGTSPRPVARPDVPADSMSDSKDVQEAAPVTAAPGLMSKPTQDATQDLLDRIAEGEGATPEKLATQEKHGIGTTPYDMVYNYGNTVAPTKPVTEMTLKELEAFQRKLINATKGKVKGTSQGTSAVGKYQVVKTSLFGKGGTAENPKKNSWADKLNLTADTVYTPEVQEAIGMLALKEAGYNSYINGERSQNSFQNRIANTWASVARADGTDTYGQGIHTFKRDLQPMFASLAPTINENPAPETSLRPRARPK